MAQDTQLDDRFTEGVWYDLETGDCCRFVETDEGIGLVEPDRPDSDPYYLFSEEYDEPEDVQSTIETDFRQVPQDAVDDPARYIVEALDNVQHDQYGQTGGPTMEEQMGISYARQNVRIENVYGE